MSIRSTWRRHLLLTWLLGLMLMLGLPARAVESITYLHNDAAGSPVAATDAAGNVIWREGYRAYGERTRNETASRTNRQFFHGKAFDADSGLAYFGARYYDPVVGRFMAIDPAGFNEANLHSFNRYAYGNNNPYRYIDPDGKAPILPFIYAAVREVGQRLLTFALTRGAQATVTGAEVAAGEALGGASVAGGSAAAVGAKAAGEVGEAVAAAKGVGTAAKSSGEVIQVTKGGVALPPGATHQIPEGYVQNPHRSGSYGEVVDGKFKERLRIDPPTPPGQKGPNYSHYHRDGKGTHYSPRLGDKDPGFGP